MLEKKPKNNFIAHNVTSLISKPLISQDTPMPNIPKLRNFSATSVTSSLDGKLIWLVIRTSYTKKSIVTFVIYVIINVTNLDI